MLRGVVEGDSVPELFLPTLIRFWEQGRFPVERLMKFYDFDAIDEAAHDAEAGRTIKPVLRMSVMTPRHGVSPTIRTQVAIVGAGPAGLTLACLLAQAGIESVVLENRSRDYVEQRIRAGLLEQGTVEVLEGAGVGERLRREGIVHHGLHLQFAGERHRIPLSDLADGRTSSSTARPRSSRT